MYQMDRTIIRNFKNTTRRELLWYFASMTIFIICFYSLLFALGFDIKPKKRGGCCAVQYEQTQNFHQ